MSIHDLDVGEAARQKAVAPLADATWHPNERVERVETIVVRNAGIKEEMFLLYTASENLLGARVNGRVLLAWAPHDTDGFEAGAFWVTEYGTKRLQSIYVHPLFRPQGGILLAEALKNTGVKQAVGPYSPAGVRYVDRHKFKKVSNVIRYRGAVYRAAGQPSAWVYELLRLKNLLEDLFRANTMQHIKEFTQQVDVQHPWLHKLPGVGHKLDKLGELLRSTSSLSGSIPDREYRALARARDKLENQLIALMDQLINDWQSLPVPKGYERPTEPQPTDSGLPPGFDGF